MANNSNQTHTYMQFAYHKEESCLRGIHMPYGRDQEDYDRARELFTQHIESAKRDRLQSFCDDVDSIALGEYPDSCDSHPLAAIRLGEVLRAFRSGMIYEDTCQEILLEGLMTYLRNDKFDGDPSEESCRINLLCQVSARVMRLGQWRLTTYNPGSFRIDLADDNVVGWMEVVRWAYGYIKWGASGIVISIRNWDDQKVKTLIGLIRESYVDTQSREGCVARMILDAAEKCDDHYAVVYMISTALSLTALQFAAPEWVLKEVES